jgi:hypothetical protein
MLRSRGLLAAAQRNAPKDPDRLRGSAKRGKSALIREDSTCLHGWRELAYSAADFDIDGQVSEALMLSGIGRPRQLNWLETNSQQVARDIGK